MLRSNLVTSKSRSVIRPTGSGKIRSLAQRQVLPSTNPTILLVDDDAAVRDSLTRVLASEGWLVVSAANGAEALQRLTEIEPALMITDLCMPEVNGWDMLFHESMHRPDLPIFVISGLPTREAGGADHYATEFFAKPLDFDALILAIRQCLGAAPVPTRE